MAISRIPGYALLANLDRQGTDLYISSNGLNLFYWDVSNYRVGINTAAGNLPQETLEVSGNILVSNGVVYSGANVSSDLGSPARYWRTVYANVYYGNISLTTGISGEITTAINTANTGMKGYVDTVSSAWTSNANSQQSQINTLLANAATQSDLIIAINANVTQANTGMKGYVDQANSIQSAQITSVSNSVTAANVGMQGYVDQANNIQSAQITTVSNSVTAANVGMKGYVDQGNSIQSGQISAANIGMKGYVDATVSTANIGMTGYVDAVTAAWTANALQQQQTIGNLLASSYSNVNVAAYLSNYTGNLTVNFLNATGNILAQTGVFSNVQATNLTGQLLTAAQPNITSLGTLSVLTVSGNVNASIFNATSKIYQAGSEVLTANSVITVGGDVTGTGNLSSLSLSLVGIGTTPGTYGGAASIPVVTVDAKGRVTNIYQVPQSLTGNLTFANTIISSTGNINLRTTTGGNIILDASSTGIVQILGPDAVQIPIGNTAQRPTNAVGGFVRYNNEPTVNKLEFYDGTTWKPVNTAPEYTITSQILPTDGITTNFPLGGTALPEQVLVIVNGTVQQPNVAYTTNGANITFPEPPRTDDVIEVRQLSSGVVAVTSLNLSGYGITINGSTLSTTGNLIPSQDQVYNLGSSAYRWKDLFLSGASIKLGNVTLKESNGNLKLRNATDTADAFLESTSAFPTNYETLAKNLSANPFTINRTNDVITTVVYTTGAGTITKAFTYVNGLISQVSISGAGLQGKTYNKFLTYDGTKVVSASYSTT